MPAIDLAEVGAGGGSISGSTPAGLASRADERRGRTGPVCYAQGGTEPTVTDANLVLGYIKPGHLVGGDAEDRRDEGAGGDRGTRSPGRWDERQAAAFGHI